MAIWPKILGPILGSTRGPTRADIVLRSQYIQFAVNINLGHFQYTVYKQWS